ncbi:uncharacterized protein LY79DRAFT_572392 [Colletotrichum navitas]|uniref:ATPase AAA-type core domain-containing protein n=1 Tax=Colletotrichum navitas TaxID=681940 RepID=A0AAD8UXF7_9PEZI|nr:uncharacterized protein LY79DRAFT_572392 [Colletotrichum navitas]KAK1566268.1 hypothetical protein LY79DRAFT_572392 [Colletotrichum navitas]
MIKRNAIVSGTLTLRVQQHRVMATNLTCPTAFLRKMEYFGGLLFLTTNRIGHIDDAFMSRVHAIIGFHPLDGVRRENIWDSLLMKLNYGRNETIRVGNRAKKFLYDTQGGWGYGLERSRDPQRLPNSRCARRIRGQEYLRLRLFTGDNFRGQAFQGLHRHEQVLPAISRQHQERDGGRAGAPGD